MSSVKTYQGTEQSECFISVNKALESLGIKQLDTPLLGFAFKVNVSIFIIKLISFFFPKMSILYGEPYLIVFLLIC